MPRGGSKGRKTSLRDLSRERLTASDMDAFYEELVTNSDRACALVGCAYLDNLLRDLLLTHMRDDWDKIQGSVFTGETAPLSTFSSRITVAYAIRAINDGTRAQLDAIRDIRNVFAHSEKPQTFAHPTIEKACSVFKQHPVIEGRFSRNRIIYLFACLDIAKELATETASRQKNLTLVRALLAYSPPASPGK